MPKQRITKEMVVDAAFEIARNSGMEQVMVKNIADKIGCSVQPIYSYCKNMDGLKQDVIKQVNRFIQAYVVSHINKDDLFRSTGKSYIQLAQEEPHLFRIFILHQREGISSLNDLYQSEANPHTAEIIAKELNIRVEQAKQLHLNMLIYTIGIGTIFSVTTPGISTDEIYTQQEVAYEAFLKQALVNDVNSITVSNPHIANIADGIYVGEYSVTPVYVKVEVSVTEHMITSIKIIEHENGLGSNAEKIVDDVISRQSLKVDAVSGATVNSKCIIKAIENALQCGSK